ncbi:MAG TPA: TIGR04423 family type III CRISPR-associated protein [Phaeodactylibacter sp.]|nr:TIGR04423 family type III CRISPR-associated protein [Phaeodactylibacter sp.]
MKIEKLNELKDIPAGVAFDGYVWMSDKKKPEVLKGEPFYFFDIEQNPFVIEALLYDAGNGVSYHVKHTGEYHIYKYDFKNLENAAEMDTVSYLPHCLEGVAKCKFKRLWVPEEDPYCEGMEVLTMKALIFCGFEYNKNDA